MKLKTLKDLESCGGGFGDHYGISDHYAESETGELEAVKKEILRQKLAIPWIKELRKGGFRKTPKIKFTERGIDFSEVQEAILTQETDIVVRWIKHTFNITDEELK